VIFFVGFSTTREATRASKEKCKKKKGLTSSSFSAIPKIRKLVVIQIGDQELVPVVPETVREGIPQCGRGLDGEQN
jgi:hypothetical protein